MSAGRGDAGDLLRLLAERLDDVGLVALDPGGTIVSWSKASERLTGLPASAVIGTPWKATFPPDATAPDELLRLAREDEAAHVASPRGTAPLVAGTVFALREEGRLVGFGERLALPVAPRPDRHAVHALTRGLAAARTVQDVVDAFVAFGLPTLGGRGGAIALPRPDGRALELIEGTATPGVVQESERFAELTGHTVTARAFRERRAIWLSSMGEYRALAGAASPSLEAMHARGFAALPLLSRERVLGVLVVETAPEVDPALRESSESMAQACAVALDRVQTVERERLAREALDAAHQRLRELSESLPMMVWTLSANGTLEYLNGAGRAYLQGDGDPPSKESVHADDLEHAYAAFKAAVRSGQPFELEMRLRRHDGVFRWHLARAVPIFDAAGGLEQWYGSTTDIDDLKRAEEGLREAEERVRMALAVGRMGTWSIVAIPPRRMETSGLPHVFGEHGPGTVEQWIARVHPQDRDESRTAFATALSGGGDFSRTHRVAIADGTMRWLRCHGRVLRDNGGRPERVVGVSVDVTEEREAERLLRESESWIRGVADATPAIVWSANTAGHIRFRNARFFEYTGVTGDRIQNLRLRDVVHPDDIAEARRGWLRTMQEGAPFEQEFRLRRADGTYRWHLARATRLQNAVGPVEWVASATDIDDQRRAFAEREDLLARTRETVRSREVFLAIAAHELRTPLTPLLLQLDGLLRMMRDRGPDGIAPERLSQRLQVAARQVRRLEGLVNALLDVSRLASGRIELHPETLDLSALVAEVVERHRHETVSPFQLVCEAPAPIVARSDRMRIEQIVSNLVSNALKYGLGSQVKVSVERVDERANIRVSDGGPGIAPADVERIFERFERATDERNHGGLGLGLWIVRHLAQALGGSVRVDSEPGRGATFVVDLPLLQERV